MDETGENEANLEDAEAAAGEVEEDVANAPAYSALPPVVHEGLRNVPGQVSQTRPCTYLMIVMKSLT